MLFSCGNNGKSEADHIKDSLNAVNGNLKGEVVKKDSTIESFIRSYNVIQDNLDKIKEKENIIDKVNKEGDVKDNRKTFRTNTYELEFFGNVLGFTSALGAGGRLLEQAQDGELTKVKVQLLGGTGTNDLLRSVMGVCQVQGLREVVPTMNDIFISKVSEGNNLVNNVTLTA